MSDCIIYILYYILAYIQHNGDVSLENPKQIYTKYQYTVFIKGEQTYRTNRALSNCVLWIRQTSSYVNMTGQDSKFFVQV